MFGFNYILSKSSLFVYSFPKLFYTIEFKENLKSQKIYDILNMSRKLEYNKKGYI